MQQESLKNKTIKGTVWSAADAFLGQGVTFIVGVILARLLSPDEYGLIGICMIFNTVLNGIVDSGFSNALIRKKSCSEEDYNTMFITNMVISVVLYILLFICTPFVSFFFGREELTSLVRVTGLVLLFNALSLTQQTILTKRIDFKTKTKASIASAVISGVLGISMAFLGFGVWSLVGHMISKQLVYTICLWVLNKWWPTFTFSIKSFRYMWGFGWKMLLSGLLNNIWSQLYQVVVGKFYSPATLGQYTRSRQFAAIFSENLTAIIQRVSYPVLSEIQDDKTRMIAGYRRVIKMSMFITIPIMFSLAAAAEPFIYCLIGPQWKEAAIFLPLICLSLSLYPLHAINLNMLQVLGRSDIFLYIEMVKKVLAIIPILIGIFINIYWMLIASIILGVINFFLNSYYTGIKLNYTSWNQIKDFTPSLLIGLLIALSVYFFKYLPINQWSILTIQIIVGFIVFYICCEKTQIEEYVEFKKIVISFIKRKEK